MEYEYIIAKHRVIVTIAQGEEILSYVINIDDDSDANDSHWDAHSENTDLEPTDDDAA